MPDAPWEPLAATLVQEIHRSPLPKEDRISALAMTCAVWCYQTQTTPEDLAALVRTMQTVYAPRADGRPDLRLVPPEEE